MQLNSIDVGDAAPDVSRREEESGIAESKEGQFDGHNVQQGEGDNIIPQRPW